MTMSRVALAAAMLIAGEASAGERTPLADLWTRVRAEIDAAVEARTPKPPVPVKVSWQPRRLATLDLGAPLLALDGADLDGDGRAELVALTTAEIVVARAGEDGELAIAARLALPAAPPSIRPRDPVGALWIAAGVDGPLVRARSSEQAAGIAASWRDGQLVAIGEIVGYPLCGVGHVELAPGRNYFDAASARGLGAVMAAVPPVFYAAACGRALVGPDGRAIDVAAAVGVDGTVTASCVQGDEACAAAPAWNRVTGAGDAIAVGDLDRDGSPELAAAAAVAPGEPDRVTVWSRGKGGEPAVAREQPMTGGVPALVVADIDGDGVGELVAAVRLASKVELWALNR